MAGIDLVIALLIASLTTCSFVQSSKGHKDHGMYHYQTPACSQPQMTCVPATTYITPVQQCCPQPTNTQPCYQQKYTQPIQPCCPQPTYTQPCCLQTYVQPAQQSCAPAKTQSCDSHSYSSGCGDHDKHDHDCGCCKKKSCCCCCC